MSSTARMQSNGSLGNEFPASLPTLRSASMKPVTYTKVPPLDKLMSKLGPAATDKELKQLSTFLEKRNTDARNSPLPDLKSLGAAFATKTLSLPVEVRFAAVDLLRCAMVDPRVSGFFAEQAAPDTISEVVGHVNGLETCPHNLRLVTIHLCCNIFSSNPFVQTMLKSRSTLAPLLVGLISTSLLDASHPTARIAAASLAFNVATSNNSIRQREQRDGLEESQQVELAASLVETLSSEENADAAKALLLALGYLTHNAAQGGELKDLMQALDAKTTVAACKHHSALAKEVATLL
jgi:desumoylating isopeptidase 1